MRRPRHLRPSPLTAAAIAAVTVAAFGARDVIGSAARASWTPKPGDRVVYALDGAETTWEVAGVRRTSGFESLALRRGEDLVEADHADVRPAGTWLGF